MYNVHRDPKKSEPVEPLSFFGDAKPRKKKTPAEIMAVLERMRPASVAT